MNFSGITSIFGEGPLPQVSSWLYCPGGVAMQVITRISETHQLQAELTEQVLEDGEIVSDHVILKPRMLAVVYEQPNSFHGSDQAWAAWEAAKALWQNRQPVSVITKHDLYSKMIIEHVSAIHESPNLGRLSFTVNLKQVNFARLSTVVLPSNLAGSVQPTASTAANGGIQEPVTVPYPSDESFLFSSFNAAFPQDYSLAPGSVSVP